MKVYLVYSGRHDDHGLDGVFSTRELAQQFIDDGKCSERDGIYIDEWELDNPPTKEEETQIPFYTIRYFYEEDRWERVEHMTNDYDTHRVFKIDSDFCSPAHYRSTYQCPDADEALSDGELDIMQFIEEQQQ